MKTLAWALINGCLPVLPLVAQAPAWPEVRLAEVPGAGQLTAPVAVRHAEDGSGRLFIVEQAGRIWVLDGGVRHTFLDIRGRVQSGGESGLLGLAFPPGFGPLKPHFYVYYTTRVAPHQGDQVLARFHLGPPPASGHNNAANPDSEEILLRLDDPYSNHNGGDIHFGPDGYLYVGLGDGGSGDDPLNAGQRTDLLWGKMLRLDVEGALNSTEPYLIPPDNPFVEEPGVLPEIWHLGLRNPWRWSFDRLTQDMWIADVGQGTREEVNYVPAGARGLNFGWRRYEGLLVRPGESELTPTALTIGTLTFPVTDMPHSVGDGSVTGGYRYRGRRFPRLYGIYVFADYISRRVYGLRLDGSGGWERAVLLEPAANPYRITSFGETESGELLAVSYGSGGADTGRLLQVGEVQDAGALQWESVQQDPSTGQMWLLFTTTPGQQYQVYTSVTLQEWEPVGGVIEATGWTTLVTEPSGSLEASRRFFRVKPVTP